MKLLKIEYSIESMTALVIDRLTGEIVSKELPKIPILGMTKGCKLNAIKRPKIRYKVTYLAIPKTQLCEYK